MRRTELFDSEPGKQRNRSPLLLTILGVTLAITFLASGCGDGDGFLKEMRRADKSSAEPGASMFRGNPAHTGEYPGPAIKNLPVVKWDHEFGDVVATTPAVDEGAVYAATITGSVHRLDANTGEVLWSFDAGGFVYSSPTVADGVLFIGSGMDGDGYVNALDTQTGQERWRFRARGEVKDSSPTIVENSVFVGTANGEVSDEVSDGYVYALDTTTGEQRWRFQLDGGVFSSPAVFADTIFIGSASVHEGAIGDGYVYAVDATTGEERWRFQTNGSVFSSPTVYQGLVFVGSSGGSYDSRAGIYDSLGAGAFYALDAATGKEHWRFRVDDGIWSSPAVVDDLVVILSGTVSEEDSGVTTVYALDPQSGKERWRFGASGPGTNWMPSSPTVVDSIVYFGSEGPAPEGASAGGIVYALDAVTGSELWRIQTEGRVRSSPALMDGVLYIATGGQGSGHVYAFQSRP